jgi:hypothetical protein
VGWNQDIVVDKPEYIWLECPGSLYKHVTGFAYYLGIYFDMVELHIDYKPILHA